MHLVFLFLDKLEKPVSPFTYAEKNPGRHRFYTDLRDETFKKISHVQRAPSRQSRKIDQVDYAFFSDEFGDKLRWWQEPAPAIEWLAKQKPDVVLVEGLDLPLNYRWLRRLTGMKTKIIGQHTGESIWPSRNLWLQQFGLRVVDAFIFKNREESRPWTKASVILARQPIYVLPSYDEPGSKSADQLKTICLQIN